MELIPNSCCSLCDENTSVLSKNAVGPFITEAGKVFFNADEHAFKQFQDELLNRSICSLCIQKISACTKFKNAYEAIIKPNGPKKARNCYVCEKKKLDCIKTLDDPNDIIAKFTLLTKYSSNTILYKDCEMCLHCLFDIHLWHELHNILIKRLNIDGQALKTFQRLNRSPNFPSSNGIVKKDKENVTPPHNNIILNKRLHTASISTDSKSRPSKKLFKQSRKSKIKLNTSTSDFSSFLSDRLKNFICLQDGLFDELNCPDCILSDYKMLNQIPYVLVSPIGIEQNSHTQERKSSKLNKPIEIIDIDSEDEYFKRTTRVSFQLHQKKISSSSENEDEDEKELKFTCNICDRVFLTRCSYKLHSLWHEKPEHCQVNLVRYELPSRVKSSEFCANKLTKPTAKESAKIDDIISKYVNTSVSEDNAEIMSETEETSEAMDLSNKDEPSCIDSNIIPEPENNVNVVDSIEIISENNMPEQDIVDTNESVSENNIPEQEISTNTVDTIESISENDDRLAREEDNETFNLNVDTCVALEEEHSLIDEKNGNEDVENEGVVENDKSVSENNNSTENFKNTSENNENDIEKALAQLHHEDETDEDDGDDKEEDFDDMREISDDKSDAVSDDDEDSNNFKRKRIESLSDDQNSSDDSIPKLKKVRFAIDYSYAKLSGQATKNKEEKLINNDVSTSLPIYVNDD